MSLTQRIADDTKAALLGGNRFVGETLRNLKAAILNEEVAAGKRDEGLSDEEVEKVIAREVKKRSESARMYRENNRIDLAEPEERELEVLKAYLPEQMSEVDIRAIIDKKIAELDARSPQDMGKVIGVVKQLTGNKADGAMVAKLVKEMLTK